MHDAFLPFFKHRPGEVQHVAWIGRWGFDHTKIQFTRTEFPSSPLGVMMAVSNKSPRLEMMRFRKKLHKFDKTKRQDGRKGCGGEGDCHRTDVAKVLFMEDEMPSRRRKSSW